MTELHNVHWRLLHGHYYRRLRVQLSGAGSARAWSPDLNAYRCRGQIILCVDLAGVEPASLELRVEPRRLQVRGRRDAPEPKLSEHKALQVLALEIDYGPFEREVLLPVEVDPERVSFEYRNGLLWVHLPLPAENAP